MGKLLLDGFVAGEGVELPLLLVPAVPGDEGSSVSLHKRPGKFEKCTVNFNEKNLLE